MMLRVLRPKERDECEPAVLECSRERVIAKPAAVKEAIPNRRHRTWPLLLVLFGIIVGIGFVVWKGRGSTVADYVTAPVSRGNVARVTVASGMVDPVEVVQIGSYVSGRIRNVFCDYNSRVVKGQSCAKIDPEIYQAAVDQDHAALGTAKAQLAKDQANLDYVKLAYVRNLSLLKHDFMSKDATDKALNVYRQAEAQVALDKSAIAEREAELKAARVNLDYTNIVSPVDGTVISRSVAIGQTVTANFQTPTLFLIATNLENMQVEADVSEAEIGDIRTGQPATFTVEAFPGRIFTGKVTQIRQAPISVQNVISYDVVIATPNAGLRLKPGMTATAHIIVAEKHDVLRVPEAALRFAPDGFTGDRATVGDAGDHATAGDKKKGEVWVERAGKLTPIAVQLGLANDHQVEVKGGALRAGDRVAIGRASASTSESP